MFHSALENSQWTDVYGPYSQINSFRNSNVFSYFLEVLHTIISLDVVRGLIPKVVASFLVYPGFPT